MDPLRVCRFSPTISANFYYSTNTFVNRRRYTLRHLVVIRRSQLYFLLHSDPILPVLFLNLHQRNRAFFQTTSNHRNFFGVPLFSRVNNRDTRVFIAVSSRNLRSHRPSYPRRDQTKIIQPSDSRRRLTRGEEFPIVRGFPDDLYDCISRRNGRVTWPMINYPLESVDRSSSRAFSRVLQTLPPFRRKVFEKKTQRRLRRTKRNADLLVGTC